MVLGQLRPPDTTQLALREIAGQRDLVQAGDTIMRGQIEPIEES